MTNRHEIRRARTIRPVVVATIALAALTVATTSPAVAQTPPSLDRAEDLTRLGRAEEARGILIEWWDRESDEASRDDLQRGLWLRARLTVDPVQAELDFRRLVVLYPRGRYTPEALLRLAQASFETGDEESARGYVATLSRDFAGSPVSREAETWLRAAGPAPAPPSADVRGAPAAQPPATARAPVTGREPSAGADRPAPPAVRDPDPDVAPERPPDSRTEPAGTYFVQLGAFAEETRAVALFEEMRSAGIDVRIVRVEGSRFLHVRFGRFVERAAAAAELERLTASGISAALVRDERSEQLVRGG
jgi:cell division septation protein DedD